ncbi:Inosine-uridine preferring nucleoside hydrolase [Rubripirellula lacrimiformis]|uniref:Inosine-uridine preferring nucleoside hydrolase n=1 Tax=Rubripirellula lacrimiformis TaxID=1930273 RepID=A0A517N568_9BACT|nr:nucleoside hydrolase [Rubripirellula lacrimiformis]QDT02251.1 Inosine-uridine preferring nucleoside hydrolase [Rubripirellula lacrimiformis]
MIARSTFVLAALLSIAAAPSIGKAQQSPTKPIPLIFDSDIGNDVDDVLAMGVIHSLQTRGECELLAVTITKDNPLAAPFTDAVNTFYGRGEIPIGVCNSGVTTHDGKFNPLAEIKDGDDFRFPHDLLSGKEAPDAVTVLRTALAAADDASVVIAQVGFSTNLANLLKSEPDNISQLNGKELVSQKVRLISIMAGAFTKIPDGKGNRYDHKEYNIVKDIPAAQAIAKDWPTPILWSGYEIGIAVAYPHESIEQDYGYVEHHPLSEAYIAYNPPPHNRPTWDLTSVLQAVRPNRDYFGLSPKGIVTVADDGLTTFVEDANGRDQYLTLTDAQKLRVTEVLVALSSEPAKQ